MKKTLLFGAAMAVASTGAIAQSNLQVVKATDHKLVRKAVIDNYEVPTDLRIPASKSPIAKSSSAISKVEIGSSYNVYSVLTSVQTALTANEDLNLIGFTHRQNDGRPGGSGVIQFTYTTNGGTSFDDIRLTAEGVSNRYPSGVLHNPSGNSNVDNAFAHVVGPQTNGSGWVNNFFATGQLDSSSIVGQEMANDPDNASSLIRDFLTSTDDGKVRVISTVDDGTVYTGGILMTGTFNSGTKGFDYVRENVYNDTILASTIEPAFVLGQAWSQDGNTGYVLAVSNDTSDVDEKWAFPHVAKTTNGGANWTAMPDFDFSTLTGLQNYLPNVAGQDYAFPYMIGNYGWDLQVDNAGQLHLSIGVGGASSTHKDSLNYLFNAHHIMHFFTTSSGWDFRYVDAIQTAEVEASTPNALGDIGWDQRIQSGRTTDGSKIFVHWAETNPEFADDNAFPDIYAWGIDAATGNSTKAVNFTAGTDYDAQNYFSFLSDKIFSNSGTYGLPISTTTPNSSNDPAMPVTHDLVVGVSFIDADFANRVGVAEVAANGFNVNIYPNPANGEFAKLNINLVDASEVTITVSNTLGQTVQVLNPGKLSGNNSITVNVADLEAGIYFYSVSANNTTVTKRLIVK